ncbi:hypothetical protein ACU6U9_02595 [Pseudomonas sp. HK3]
MKSSILSTDSNHLSSINRERREKLLNEFSPELRAELKNKALKKLAQKIYGWEFSIQRMALMKIRRDSLDDYKKVRKFLLDIEMEKMK